MAPSSTRRLSIFPISGHGRYQVPMVTQTLANTTATATYATGGAGAAIVSAASITDQSNFQFQNLALPNNGDSLEYEVQGYFGANANTKRIKINSSGSGLWFDTGALTENGTAFVLRFKRTKVSGADHSFHAEFQTSAARVVQRAANNGGGALNSVFTVTGTSAGDVTVTSIVGRYCPSGT